jgi:hypothetical protein
MDGVYLEYLLGLELEYATREHGSFRDARMPNQAFAQGWSALLAEHVGAYCTGRSQVLPEWRKGRFEFVPTGDFQSSVYVLLSESWRAKVCRRCERYFIADKPAQVFCSPDCSNKNKHEGGRRYWHEKGASRRQARTLAKKHNALEQRDSRSNKRAPKKGQPR